MPIFVACVVGLTILGFAIAGNSDSQWPVSRARAGGPSLRTAFQLQMLQQEIAYNQYNYTVGYNPAMDYRFDQLAGLVEPEDWREEAIATSQFKVMTLQAVLPSSFDWRDEDGVTPIKNQGGCGSCWSFATVGLLESQVKIQTGDDVDLSEQYLVSCNEDFWGCGGGWWAHDYHAWKIPSGEQEAGAVVELDFPYEGVEASCDPAHPHAYVIDDWGYVGTYWWDMPTVEEIKQAIYEYGPVATAVAAGPAMMAYTGGVFDNDESHVGVNHAVMLVGWDDAYEWNGSTFGVWILKNSWGTGWGEQGYMYIAYDTSLIGYAANYVEFTALDAAEPDKLAIIRQRQDDRYKLQVYAAPASNKGDIGELLASDNSIGINVTDVASGDFDPTAGDEFVMIRHDPGTGVRAVPVHLMPDEVRGDIGGPIASDTDVGGNTNFVAVGNFDDDEELELAFAQLRPSGKYKLLIYDAPTDVDDDLGSPIASDSSIGRNVIALAAANFDEDGRDEIVVVTLIPSSGKHRLYIHDVPTTTGGSTSVLASDLNIGKNIITRGVAAGNFDDDSDAEIAIVRSDASGSHKVHIYDAPTEIKGDMGASIASDLDIGQDITAIAACSIDLGL
jgi:C1A family cysteine protease